MVSRRSCARGFWGGIAFGNTGANNQLADWQRVAEFSNKQPHVLASAPYITAQGMLSYDQGVQGAIIRGVAPGAED